MSLERKSFAMSMFAKSEDLFRAKAQHYEEQAEKLQMENVVLAEQLAHVERELFELAQENDRLEKLLFRHEQG